MKKSEFHVIMKNGKPYLRFSYTYMNCGKMCEENDDMRIYGINDVPYIKRLGSKMNLEPYMVEELNALI